MWALILPGALLVVALLRRPQCITIALAGAYIASIPIAGWADPVHRLPLVIAMDCAVVAIMGYLFAKHGSERAQWVGTIGALKIMFAIIAVMTGLDQPVRASAINAAFALQVMIAGSLADGFLAWVGHCALRVRSSLSRMRDNVGA